MSKRKPHPRVVAEWNDRLRGRFRLVWTPYQWIGCGRKRRFAMVIEEHRTDALGADRWVHCETFYPGDDWSEDDNGEPGPTRVRRLALATLAERALRRRRRRAA